MNVHRLYQNPLPDPESLIPTPRQPVGRMDPPRADRNRLVCALLARRWTVLVTIVACMLAAGLVVLRTPVIYSASALVRVAQAPNDASGRPGPIEDQMRVLQSSLIAERVIAKLNLSRDREFTRDDTSIFNPLAWLGEAPPKIRAGTSGVDPAVLQRFASRLTLTPESPASVVRVTFESTNRNKAALVANTIVGEYIAARAVATSMPGLAGPVDEHLNQLTEAVTQAERALEQYKTQTGTGGADGTALANDQITELNGQIAAARAELATHEANHRQAAALAKAASPIAALRKRQDDLARKEADLALKYGDRHPQMIALREEKTTLANRIDEETKKFTGSSAAKVTAAKARVNSLEASLRDLQGTTTAGAPAAGPALNPDTLRDLESDLQARRTALQQYQANPDQPQIKGDAAGSGPQMVRKATAPESPSSPDAPMIMGATFFGSTIFAFLLALVLDRQGNTFRTANQIERFARVHNLAVVPRTGGKHIADRIVQKPHSPYSEALRSLYSGLQLSNIDRAPRVVVVTSSVANEGKTSLAVSLGRLVAKSGARVLLIDGDLRRPSVGATFSPRRPQLGLVEILLGQCNFRDIVHRDPISPLEFVPVAEVPPNPTDILGSLGIQKMIEVLRQHYDLIIIDAAPVLPVPDTRLLARLADKMIYVVRWESTPREAVITGMKLLRDVHADIAGTVLNHADMRRHAIYGYGTAAYGYDSKQPRYNAQ